MTKEERNTIKAILAQKSPEELIDKYDYFTQELNISRTREEGLEAARVLALIREEIISRMS